MLTATFREMFQTIHLDQIKECPHQQTPLGVTTYLKSPALLLIIQRERASQRERKVEREVREKQTMKP